jgi:hypothetical protein
MAQMFVPKQVYLLYEIAKVSKSKGRGKEWGVVSNPMCYMFVFVHTNTSVRSSGYIVKHGKPM